MISTGPASEDAGDRPSPPQFVLGVDLDGVCVDFLGAIRPIAADWLGVPLQTLTDEVTYGFPEWKLDTMGGYEALHRYAVTQRRLFATAPPIQGAPAAIRRLAAHDDIRIRIITNRLFIPYFHKAAASQTIDWLDRQGILYRDLCLLPDKAAVGANLYIDDTPDNVEALRTKNLETIVFSNSTNRKVDPPRADNWTELEEMILERVRAWRESAAAKTGPAGR